ncbi:hypothetical protein Mpop_0189 [Methylorubrum populi BJ001]|jgi:hypothetical protein|uniref:Uncharacterized protein n=3 Tax=Methylobacteriaceae TaxID=119045 RepID=B1ZG45_METPB|nr:hypothetical protein Mpop_0189 [Methylorubrum populi BJ001]OAH28060.1 hypothetical protein AX289_24165 [Methylorubrum populi]PZP67834.1 MAG: hypothetical protein DI590_19330 [Methylorubrum populi]GJE74886.1 hypothetical protein BGCPKDLD_1460 [Methylorubrum suomiense]
MASASEEHRAAWDFYRLSKPAQTVFRGRVVGARCGEPDVVAAFAAVGVTNSMRPPVMVYDDVAAALVALPGDGRLAIEVALFGQALTPQGPAALVRETLARGRAIGHDDRQLAGAITVVLESHGHLASEAAL